jgi:hypothetical protein
MEARMGLNTKPEIRNGEIVILGGGGGMLTCRFQGPLGTG